jgi:hypothetical protein
MADSSSMRAGLKGNVEEALRLFAMEAEWGGLNLAETEFVLEEALKCYGSIADASQVRNLFAFYHRYLGMADVGRRQALLTRITEFVSAGRQNRYLALLCFLNADTDGQIISGAALDVAMVMPQESGDPLTGPRHVALHSCGGLRAKMGRPGSDDEGYAAAGLLLLGDMRLLPLLEEIWERLTPEARRRMVQRRSNLVSALMVEFLLRRLEADKAEEYFGELGAALHNLPEIASQLPISAVMDIRRNFGLPAGKEPMELLGRETLAEAFARIRPRLEALIARESEPKVLPAALAAWAEAAGVEIEEDSEASEEGEDDEDDADAEDDLEDEDEYPDVMSHELHDEFEAMSDGDGFADASEDIYFWHNPYKTKSLTAIEVKRELTAGPVFPILVTGIFNPFGPTLNVYLIQKDNLDEWTFALLRLNPFSCTKADLGKLDPQRVRLEPGVVDAVRSGQEKFMVMNGRDAKGLEGVHDYILRVVLGRSRLQQSFTLCHSTTAVSRQKALERVALAYQGMKNGRDDLNDLRDKKKRTDPWARADMAEAMRRLREPQAAPAPLSESEAKELAGIVLTPQQQRIEMLNLIQAWEGAIEHAGLTPVLTREQLLGGLAYLTPDMPNLIKLKGDYHVAEAAQMAPTAGLAPAKDMEKVKAMESPAEEERPMTPAEKIAAAMATPPVPKDETTYPQFDGLLGCLNICSFLELSLGFVAIFWALICTEWVLALALTFFWFLHIVKVGLIVSRIAWSRWFAVGNYGWILAYMAYRIDRHNSFAQAMTGAGLLLVQIMTIWAGVMGLVYLSYFRFAKTMQEAPEVKN